jgi:hypothetical protein
MRNQRPFAPVHMRAQRRADGGIDLSWMRCARLGGDVWGPVEPPLEPGGESYRVEVVASGQFKRAWTVTAPTVIYSAAEQVANFSGPAGAFVLRVAQLSNAFGLGAFGESAIAV